MTNKMLRELISQEVSKYVDALHNDLLLNYPDEATYRQNAEHVGLLRKAGVGIDAIYGLITSKE